MNLSAERMHILRALAHGQDTAMVHDPSLPIIVRQLFSVITSKGLERARDAVQEMLALYDEHGPPLLRCILENSFLLHSTSETPQMFRAVFARLGKDLHSDPLLPAVVANELNKFGQSPYDLTQQLVALVLQQLATVPGQLQSILENPQAGFPLRYAAGELVVADREVNAFDSLLRFVMEIGRETSKEAFLKRFQHLVRLNGMTGEIGIERAVAAFKRGELATQGPFILSWFRDDFHAWFAENPQKPSIEWASVLLQAWSKARKLQARDKMLSLIVDEWSAKPSIARYVRDALSRNLRKNSDYLSSASHELQDIIKRFIGNDASENLELLAEQEIRERLLQQGKQGSPFRKWHPKEKVQGRGVAKAFAGLGIEQQKEIEQWVNRSKSVHFISGFFDYLLTPKAFSLLSNEAQTLVIGSPKIVTRCTSDQIDLLTSDGKDLASELLFKLRKLKSEIIRRHGQGRYDTDVGKLT